MWFYFKKNTITFQSVPKSAGSRWLLRVNLPYEAKSIFTKINLAVKEHEVLVLESLKKIIDVEHTDEQTDSLSN